MRSRFVICATIYSVLAHQWCETCTSVRVIGSTANLTLLAPHLEMSAIFGILSLSRSMGSRLRTDLDLTGKLLNVSPGISKALVTYASFLAANTPHVFSHIRIAFWPVVPTLGALSAVIAVPLVEASLPGAHVNKRLFPFPPARQNILPRPKLEKRSNGSVPSFTSLASHSILRLHSCAITTAQLFSPRIPRFARASSTLTWLIIPYANASPYVKSSSIMCVRWRT